MSVRIIADSTCDLTQEQAKNLNIDILPLKVIFGEEQYSDGIDLSSEEFFEKLANSKTLPTTSQINPEGFVDTFKKYADNGDEIVCITIASGISGTYQSAVIAKYLIESDNIYIVDSTQATFGASILIYEAIKMRDNGSSAKEIFETIEKLKSRVVFYGVVDTLKYLKMGGRLSATAAALGGLLNIKPIVCLKDGVITSVGKARGQHAAFDLIDDYLKKNPPSSKFPLSLAHANSEEDFVRFKTFLTSKGYDAENAYSCKLGCVIGTHSGPGCVGIAYISK